MSASVTPTAARGEVLAPETGDLVTAFARACRAAARAIALYPAEHPAVAAALTHIVTAAQALASTGEVHLSVLPDTLTIKGRRPARADAAVSDLAALLHAHQIGQLHIAPQSEAGEWRRFLALLALPPEQTRQRGGLASLWASEGQTRITAKQIDYKSLLAERIQGDRATWEAIIEQCLEGDAQACDDWMLDLVLDIVGSPDRVSSLLSAVEQRVPQESGRGPLVIAGLMQAVARFVATSQPDQLEPLLVALAGAAARLPLQTLAPIASARQDAARPELARFVEALGQRMSDAALADQVVAGFRAGQGSSPLIAQTLGGLVPDVQRRSSILALARQALEQAPARVETAGTSQRHVEQMLASHDDARFISTEYAQELQRAGARAIDLDADSTDGPDVLGEWAASVADDRVRLLDAQVLVDLMRLKQDQAAWREIAALAVARIDVLVVLGDFGAAAHLAESLRQQQEAHPAPEIREAAREALGQLLGPELMRHVASHLDTSDPTILAAARRFCQAIGTQVIPRLAEALSREERTRPRRHLIGILTAFGPAGRQSVERLMQSSNPAVRRTAVQLLREFGGVDAVSELESLLNDEEPHVQREATYAIAMLGMEPAYAAVARALIGGSARSRDAITSVLWTLPPEATGGILSHLVTHAPLGGAMRAIHERAYERLAAVGGAVAVDALDAAMHRGSQLAPFRTAALRRLAAQGLARVGTPEAIERLRTAAAGGPRSLRAAARAALAQVAGRATEGR